eukprot:scaffold169406_cov24-Tisochrysis_lutea.AAC.1
MVIWRAIGASRAALASLTPTYKKTTGRRNPLADCGLPAQYPALCSGPSRAPPAEGPSRAPPSASRRRASAALPGGATAHRQARMAPQRSGAPRSSASCSAEIGGSPVTRAKSRAASLNADSKTQ